MKKLILLGALVTMANLAQASLFTYDFNSGFNNGGVIPDGNPAGWFDTRNITDIFPVPDAGHNDTILDVNVRLNISGGYNGDLYGYLVHSSGFAVLLNRSGRTATDSFGYPDAGFNITIDGQATGHTVTDDIHRYSTSGNNPTFSGGRLTGAWLEDGRTANPATVTDSDSRTALLSSFNSLNGNGTWTLFLADMASGDQSTVLSWGLDITVVPEPITWALIIFGGALGAVKVGRHWRSRKSA